MYLCVCTFVRRLFCRNMSWKLKCPFTAIIAGPSSSGKTEYALSIIEEQATVIDCKQPFAKVIWCHGIGQTRVFDRLRRLVPVAKLRIIEGFPTQEINSGKLLGGGKPKLLILDDLFQEVEKNSTFFNLFTKLSHHTNTSVIFISQVRKSCACGCV